MWGAGKRCVVLLGFDFDAETLWLCRGLKTASPVSRGKYGAYVGVPRVLRFLEEEGFKSTFFVPGWVAENYGSIVKECTSAGHEVAHHGWLHDDPNAIPIEQERDEFLRGIDVFANLGIRPSGYRSPAFDLGPNTLNLLEENKYAYDTSMMAYESPYVISDGGRKTRVVELPVCWELDDAPFYLYTNKPAYRQGLADPDMVYRVWASEFRTAYRETGFYLLTLHPQISGRGYRLEALRRLVTYIRQFPGVWFATHEEAAAAFSSGDGKLPVIDLRSGYPADLGPWPPCSGSRPECPGRTGRGARGRSRE